MPGRAARRAPIRRPPAARQQLPRARRGRPLRHRVREDRGREGSGRAGRRRRSSPTTRPSCRSSTCCITQALRDRASDVHIEPQDDHDPRAVPHRRRAPRRARRCPAAMAPALVSRIKIMAEHEHRRAPPPAGRPVRDRRSTAAPLDMRVSALATIWGEKCVIRLLDNSRSALHAAASSACPTTPTRRFAKLDPLAVRHGAVRRPDRQRQDDDALRRAARDQRAAPQHHDDRGPGRVRVPVDQPDPDQRAGRHHVRHRPQVDPAPGPRRHPRRRDPRRRDGPHRRAVGAHRPLRAVVRCTAPTPSPRCTGSSTWASSRSSSPRRWSPSSASASCGGSAPRARSRTRPTDEELAFYEESGGTPKTTFVHGAGCNFCADTGYQDRIGVYELLRITPEIKRLVVGWATQEELRRLAVSQGMRTLQHEAHRARRAGRHHDRRSHPKHLRGSEEAPMPKFTYTAIDADGATRHGRRTRRRRLGAVRRRAASARDLHPVEVREQAEPPPDRDHQEEGPEARSSCTSAASSRCSCAPASRSSTASTSSPRRRRTRSSPRCSTTCSDALRERRDVRRRRGRAPRGVPDLLHRHPALGRADRQPRHRPRPARRLHRPRHRGPQQDHLGADLPGDRARHGGRHRRRAHRLRAAPVRDFFDSLDAELPLADADPPRRSPTSSATWAGSSLAGHRRSRSGCRCSASGHERGRGAVRPRCCCGSRPRRHRPARHPRALLPGARARWSAPACRCPTR